MNHPPYHLRPNKAVDRFLLVETIKRISKCVSMDGYTYYGLGGPFLEDFRLLNEHCPEIALTSLEANQQTYKRQQFHKFIKHIDLRPQTIEGFLPTFASSGKEVFWLDYTNLHMSRFDEFMRLLGRVDCGTIIKITLRAQEEDNPHHMPSSLRPEEKEFEGLLLDFREEFEQRFEQVLPAFVDDSDFVPGKFPELVHRMVQVAAEGTFPAVGGTVYQPLHSAYYMDGTWMLSVTGIVCNETQSQTIQREFKEWKFANLSWEPPHHIDMPILSVKERLFLENLLPEKNSAGESLAKALGYRIGDSESDNLRRLQQYADFHRYYPHFAKVTV